MPLVPGTGRQPVLGRCQDKGGPVAGTLRGRAEGPGAEASRVPTRLTLAEPNKGFGVLKTQVQAVAFRRVRMKKGPAAGRVRARVRLGPSVTPVP